MNPTPAVHDSPARETGPPARGPALRASDERDVPAALRLWIARTLRTGVAVSAALLAVGLAELGLSGGFTAAPARLSEALVSSGAAWPAPAAWLTAGVFALLLTPFARVLLSAGVFGARRDAAFTAITLFVLLVLVASVLVGVRS